MWALVRRWFRPEPQRIALVLEPGTSSVGPLLNAIAASMPDDADDWPDW